MRNYGKKFLAILLTLCMLLSVLPMSIFAAENTAEVTGQQLMLGDDLTMHFYVKTEAANAAATIQVGGVERAAYSLAGMTAGENGYDLSVELAAAEMTEKIVLTVNDGTGDILTKTYSVQDYAHYLLENNYTDETKSLVKEMLNYGAKAQLYFGHKTDALANAVYPMETEAVIAADAPALEVSDSLSDMSLYGASMVFKSKIAVRFYFSAQNGVEGYTFKVGENTYEPTLKGDRYYIEVADINPDQMDTALAVSVTKDEGSLSFSYSPMDYIIRMYNKDSSSQQLKDMLKAANGYFQAAKVFTGVAENRTGSLSFAMRAYSTNQLFQVNTNLPSDTPCVNFTASDNGSNIDQSANQYQQVGWIGMDNVDGTIVLTFHFNAAFEAGQTYTLPKGAVFGFTDNSKYTLDRNYSFNFDGTSWTMKTPEDKITLAYRYGTASLIQFNSNLPESVPCVNFTTDNYGCAFIQSGDQTVGWIGMEAVDGTTVLTFHFNADFAVGQSYTLSAGSVFGFTDGSVYELYEDITLYWDGASWSNTKPVPEVKNISLTYRWGNNNTIQYNTDLPATTPCVSFTASDNGCNLQQNANQYQQVGWIGMDNVDGTIVLTFHFNGTFEAGQSYIIPAGSVFGFTDGNSYTLPDNVILYWDGAAWDTTEPITLTYRFGTNNLIQYNTNLPSDTPCANFTADQNGCNLSQSANTVQQVGWIGMENVNGTIVLTFHFNSAYTYGQSYILSAGSVFVFTDGSSYKLYQDTKLYWDDSQWTTEEPAPQVDVLDESNFTGGKEFTTFADLPVDSNSVEKIEEYKGLGFNTSLLAEDHTGAKGPDELFTASLTTANAPENSLNFQYRWGAGNVFQVNTNLPASTPLKDFLATDNGCSIDQSANQYKNVGYISMANADGVIVLTFNFGSAFEAGQNYVLPKGAVFGFTDGSTYTLDADYTFTWDGTTWTMDSSALSLSLNAASGKYIQLKTNIPTGLSYGDFLLGDSAKGHNVILETTEGAQAVAWFTYSELSGAVYLTFNFNGYNKAGTQYILKAGTSLKAGDNTYVTDRDYILTVENAYLTSLQNLDNAGLNVWIRNYHNTPDYFTDDLTAALLLYKDIIDGFYMTDEPFQTNALLQASGQANITDFEGMVTLRDWFNTNFADKYFHINHVPITSYDHYTSVGGEALSALNAEGYKKFLQIYKERFNDLLTNASGASISFDNYPFIHDQGTYKYGILNLQSKFESGIQSTYLLNCLIAAQVAAEDDFGLCVQTFEATDLTYDVTRDITSAAEVSLQLYTGMAMGADVFEYFAYNSNGDFDAIMNQDGSKRIYDIVKEGNGALSMHDVVNTFTWNGIVTSEGSVNSHNTEAFTSVENMVLTNISNGVLNSYSSTDDAIIGCFTKGDLNGYMVVNFNDPKAVTGNNTVSLSFENCTRARIYTVVDGVLTSQLVDLTNGSCEVVLAPGSGCFVIPA